MDKKFKDTIEGEYVILRKVTIEDAEDIYKWRSGISGTYLRQPENYTIDTQKAWIEARTENEINYVIIDAKTKIKVGFIGIYEVNDFDKVANVGRLLLDGKYLSKSNPYGLESLLLMFSYVFNEMNFRKITGDIVAQNIQMYKLQIFLGMQEEGLLKEHVLINNRYEDLWIMSIFKDHFEKVYCKRIKFLLKGFT